MIKFNFLLLSIILIFSFSCSREEEKKSLIFEKNIESQMLEAYKEGLKELKNGDILFAVKKFNEAEILFPQSDWAPKAALMAAYSYYSQDYYGDAIAEIERFIKVYPSHQSIDYAYFLLGTSYYEQIVDEKKDLQSIINAKKNFEYILKAFPNTDYALDAQFKMNMVYDILASKEMYIGRYYFEKKKWIPAINRFRTVVDDYDKTIYIEEALHRLVEIYYTLGLKNEAKKYAKLLGYNYQSSQWYERSYSLLNKAYVKKTRKRKKENSTVKKIKSLFE